MGKSNTDKAIDNARRICEQYKEFGSEATLRHIEVHVRDNIMNDGLGPRERDTLKNIVYGTFMEYFPDCRKVNEMLSLDSGY